MICLLDTHEVMCFHHDANFKITYVTALFMINRTNRQLLHPPDPIRSISVPTPTVHPETDDQQSD